MKGILGRDLFMRFWWADIPRICVENPAPGKSLQQLLEQLDAGECKGIKSAAAYKIAEFAREQGYLE